MMLKRLLLSNYKWAGKIEFSDGCDWSVEEYDLLEILLKEILSKAPKLSETIIRDVKLSPTEFKNAQDRSYQSGFLSAKRI